MNLVNWLRAGMVVGQKWVVRNAPDVLTGASIGLGVAAVGLSIPATTRAEKKIAARQDELDILAHERGEPMVDMTNWQKVQAAWTCYIPTITALGASIACAVFANRVSATRLATLATACSLGEKKLSEYQKAIDNLEKEDRKKIQSAINDERIKNGGDVNGGTIEETGHGSTLFIDMETGRRFRASYGWVAGAFKRISDNMVNEMTQSINNLYTEMELGESNSGNSIGWVPNDWPLNPYFDERTTETGEKYYVITYPWSVIYDFRNY